MKVWLGNIKNELFTELLKMGIVEILSARGSTITCKDRNGNEVRIKIKQVPVYDRRGRQIDIKWSWEVV